MLLVSEATQAKMDKLNLMFSIMVECKSHAFNVDVSSVQLIKDAYDRR